jgi:hypothetical protein
MAIRVVEGFGSERPAGFLFSEDGKTFFGIATDRSVVELSEIHVEFSPDNKYVLILLAPRQMFPSGTKNHGGIWDVNDDYLYDISRRVISKKGNFPNFEMSGYVATKMGWKKSGGHALLVEYKGSGKSAVNKTYSAEKWFSSSMNKGCMPYSMYLMRPLQWAVNNGNTADIKKLMKDFSAKVVKWFTAQVKKA